MSKLLNESKYRSQFQGVTFLPGILMGKNLQIYYLLPAALKDILTEKGFHTKSGKVESLISYDN
jgi:hypothetical protein